MLGLVNDDDIKKTFSSVDNGGESYILRTLEKDSTHNTDEAFIEIYKRLRPGELATVDTARDLLEGLFSSERYDLSTVGRHKMNVRLNVSDKERAESRTLMLADLVDIVSQIIRMNNNPAAMPDDIDHLGNRRLRGVGEMLQNKLRIGMMRMKRTVQDRMSTLDINTLTPAQLINSRPFMA